MTSQHPRPEDSLALAMIELDRLERERLDTETLRREALAHARSQAKQLEQLEHDLKLAWPRAIARERRRASLAHRRSLAHQRSLGRELEREHGERLDALARQNAERRATLDALERAAAAEPAPHVLQRAAQWLAPFAAMGLVALVGLFALHEPTLAKAESSVVPLAAVAEPVPVDAITEASPATQIDAPLVVAAPTPAASKPASKPSKPASKPSKPASKPSSKPKTEPSEPLVKPRTKPIVLGGGDDPLGDL
jgi:hypothetical protein